MTDTIEIDGQGAEHVAGAHLVDDEALIMRPAAPGDELLLLDWANDPAARRYAANPNPITPEVHRAWFVRRLADPENSLILMVERLEGRPVGYVRFERKQDEWEVSYFLTPEFRGQGMGKRILKEGFARLAFHYGAGSILARVVRQNVASVKTFEALNFNVDARSEERMLLFRRAMAKLPG